MCLPWWFSDVCTVVSHFTCQVYSTGWVAPVPLTGRGSFAASSWLVYGRQPIRVFAAHSEPLASPHASCSSHILIQQHNLWSTAFTIWFLNIQFTWSSPWLCFTYPLNSEIDNVTNYVSTVPIRELGLGLGVEHLSDDQAQELTNDYSLPALKVQKLTLLILAGLYSWIPWYFIVFCQYLGMMMIMIFICK